MSPTKTKPVLGIEEETITRFLTRNKEGEFTEMDPHLLNDQRMVLSFDPNYEEDAYYSWYSC